MTEPEETMPGRVPTRIQVLASRVIVKAGRKLGKPVEPEILYDAEFPLEKARPDVDRSRNHA